MEDDGFVLVRHKAKHKQKRKGKSSDRKGFAYAQVRPAGEQGGEEDVEKEAAAIVDRVRTCRRELEGEPFWAAVAEGVEGHWASHWTGPVFGPVDVVVYGIGSVQSSPVARAQLALLLLLRDRLQAGGQAHLYEPILTPAEKTAVQLLGLQLIDTNEECKRCVSGNTVFYMPHCGARLYNNMLWANWGDLSRVMLLGNSLAHYHTRHPSALLAAEVPYVHKVVDWVDETPLPVCRSHPTSFLNTSIMTFARTRHWPADWRLPPPQPGPLNGHTEL
eukprot:comp18148_c0_seq1/m.18896 comp18148_c0_seq1/g.18896  ORF comp18148_c0_seq1/g.18896 comp18148_c0_seq1/m.18896 type:complete len:275 (-) comp18148_c0_seq1:711-1535(-)